MDLKILQPELQEASPTYRRPTGAAPPTTDTPFTEALARAGSTVVDTEASATRAIQTFVNGAQGNLHETLLAVDKAEISLKLLVTVRNRLVDAYREVMRMGA